MLVSGANVAFKKIPAQLVSSSVRSLADNPGGSVGFDRMDFSGSNVKGGIGRVAYKPQTKARTIPWVYPPPSNSGK